MYRGKFALTEGFFALQFWGTYIWRGLFSEFYGCQNVIAWCLKVILEKKNLIDVGIH